ncbi:DNA-methyltransferase [Pseudomonas sp.]|uniref:DNA-methyltransferase n=1 Tax=Pseudomonas sp. TaxID=306 RepID=UPI002907718C|nr:DNA methyltransferase [Pseudomonas sp.]MDU4249038.1 DNA methyltransferase [Pseudomonas sp.]
MGKYRLIHGDCLAVLRTIPDCSIDSIVTDPPYGLTSARPGGRSEATRGAVMGGFMGLAWDSDIPAVEVWAECLRVLKPGGHLLAFAGTRTQHRMACRIEDAGFELRDMIAWVYGSGFPKSKNLRGDWQGWGTALKPALEPITVARKPLIGTVAANVLAHGTGALNIDGCRVGGVDGRWPANLIHDGSPEVIAAFPDAPGQMADISTTAPSLKTSNVYGRMSREGEASSDSDNAGVVGFKMKPGSRRLDAGSAARFFYCAKASRKDRNDGCEHMERKPLHWSSGAANPGSFQSEGTDKSSQNNHPTVKPTDLMAYLCRLVTRPGGVVLDPFMGSGSTGKACMREGFEFIGIEREVPYLEIAEARIAHEIGRISEHTSSAAQMEMFREVSHG